MRVLLVGGAGHVGKLITPYLKARHTIRVLDLGDPGDPDIEYVKGSVLDPEAIRTALADVDVFVWLAMRNGQGGMVTNQSLEDIVNNYDLNTKALHLFLYLAQEAGVKRGVYTSSMSVHYRGRPFYAAEADVPLDSPSVYGLSKGLGEGICAYFARWFGTSIISLRISGPRSREAYLKERRNPPQRAGDGSFVYPLDEEDMANAYLGAIETVAKATEPGFEAVFIVADENGEEHDLGKAERLIGWKPQSQRLI
ncbi:NAD(P)-dependent oxidoreductase [Devosia ginsengisoli]|uniref:NAD-dependent epimerase/dehydratase family protein n=1 Tax=Devosia ginsengisoli TaxID=400770 RepID=UPI0026EA5984|nr:NAD(P)-dependent oxidoreductase [Devosia ginsengisoli]MCR6671537.1 NAD(P)-dependent oxidoreductase [Devosia ginsengisoli]